MKKDVFRKSALEKIATLDQLDKMLKVTSPMSWLALLGVTIIIGYVVWWSFTGSLTSTVTANGMLVSSTTATNTIRSDYLGTVDEIFVREGDRTFDESFQPVPLMRITYNGESQIVYAHRNELGVVAEICVNVASRVYENDELFRISPYVTGNQRHVAVCYVSSSDIGKIKIDQNQFATITLASADSSTYGHMEARVINVDTQPTTQTGIEKVIGSNNGMYSTFTSNNPSVCAVTCELFTDDSTASGYQWSNKKGKDQTISDKQVCVVRIVTDEQRPIEKAFAKLKELWGE